MTTKRGNAVEAHAIGLLERLGYAVEKARAVRKRYGGRVFNEVVDFFGAFDLIAVKPDCRTLFLQVTTAGVAPSVKKRQIEPALLHMDPAWHDVQIWRWVKPAGPGQRGGFKIHRWDESLPSRTKWFISTDSDRLPWTFDPQRTLAESG